jgi:hypothetical protein
LPLLPSGYTAAAAWGFHDAEGLAYEFFRVYGPTQSGGDRGDLCVLDEALSYWAVSWPVAGQAAGEDEHIAWRAINYREARLAAGPELRFARFSSPLAMLHEIPRLLADKDIAARV